MLNLLEKNCIIIIICSNVTMSQEQLLSSCKENERQITFFLYNRRYLFIRFKNVVILT